MKRILSVLLVLTLVFAFAAQASAEGVKEALASHEKKEVLVRTDRDIPRQAFADVIKEAGYEMLEN